MRVVLDEQSGTADVYRHLGDADEVFSSHGISYNVTALYEVVRAYPADCAPVTVTMTPEDMAALFDGVRVCRARAARIELPIAQAEPLLAVALPDGGTLIVDGHHRMTRLAAAGIYAFETYVVPLHLQPPNPFLESLPISQCTPEMLGAAISREEHRESMLRSAHRRGWLDQEIREHYPYAT